MYIIKFLIFIAPIATISYFMLAAIYAFGGEFKENYTQEEIIEACVRYKAISLDRHIHEYEHEVAPYNKAHISPQATNLVVFYNGKAVGVEEFNCFKILDIARFLRDN